MIEIIMEELEIEVLRKAGLWSDQYGKPKSFAIIERLLAAESDNETLRLSIRNNAIANAELQQRLLDAANKCAELQDKLQATESKLKLIDGVSQDAIDGGWTSYGLSSYAKSLEKNNAELYARLNSLINPCEQTQQSNELYDDTHAKLNIEKVDHTFTHRFKNAMPEGGK